MNIIPKLECYHVDTCLSDYWAGHRRPHLSVIIPHKGMTIKELKLQLLSELNAGAIAGNYYDWETLESEQFYKRAKAAINRIRPAKKGQRKVFTDIEYELDDNGEYEYLVYAYFVFMEMEQ